MHDESSQSLIIEYTGHGWKGVFVTGHAPTDMADIDSKQSFWDKLKRFQNTDLFLMIDANSRIGSETDYFVGTFAADETNDNGFLFHAFLRQLGLWVPATFEENVWDPTASAGTWLSRGGWKRIDYIATNMPKHSKVQTWLDSIEKDTKKDDHCVVCMALQVQKRPFGQGSTKLHSTLRVDRAAMVTEEGKQQCAEVLKSMNTNKPSWGESADAHAMHFTKGAQEALEELFPFAKSKPKPSWISKATWDTLKTSRWARRKLKELKTSWDRGVLRAVFQGWKNQQVATESYCTWIRAHDVSTALALQTLDSTRALRIQMLRADEAAFLQARSQQAADELSEAKGTKLWSALKTSLPKFRRKAKKPLPMSSAHLSFEQHFADIEEARQVSMTSLVSQSVQRSQQALAVAVQQQMTIAQVPSVFELEDAIRSLTNHKAFVGCVPAELLKASPAEAADMLFPAMVMFFKYMQQPTSWKGGQYYPLYKGKGSPASAGNFRAILIGNVIPKVFHKIVRKRLMSSVQPSLLPFQIGGVPRMSVRFAAHFLQCLRHQANLQKKSSAVIFFDLKSAFYRAQRSTVVADRLGYGDDIDDEDVALSTLGKPSALEDTGVPPALQQVIQELFSQTWCTVTAAGPSTSTILQSVRGTRPGDPVADLAFTCVMKQILERFMQIQGPALPCMHTAGGTTTIPAITWVDDVAIYLEAASAADLLPMAKSVVQTMHQQCRAVGLDLNYSHGKTEVLFRFHGRESDKIRRQLHQEGSVELGEGDWSEVHLPVATKYTHLGIKHSANVSFDVELNYRLARAREAMAECRKPVLRNKALSSTTRWTLGRSLILSRLFFGAEIWPALSQAQLQKVQQFLVQIARVILQCENFSTGTHTTDDYIGSQLPIPDVQSLLRTARLRYASRLYQFAPSLLVELLEQMQSLEENSWLHRLQADMQWMQERTPALKHMYMPHLDFESWKQKLRCTSEWTAMANRALEADTLYKHNVARYLIWRMAFHDGLRKLGCELIHPLEEDDGLEMAHHECQVCQRAFHSARALAVHKYKQHQQHADVRFYMDSTTCGACLKNFHTVQRLRQHLQYPKGRCLTFLRSVWMPLDPQALVNYKPGIDTKAAHRIPAFQCFGPKLPERSIWQQAAPERSFPWIEPQEAPGTPQSHVPEDGPSATRVPEIVELDPQPVYGDLVALVAHWQQGVTQPPQWPLLETPEAFDGLVQFSRLLHFEVYIEIYSWIEQLLSKHFALSRKAKPQPAEQTGDPAARMPTVPQPKEVRAPTWQTDFHIKIACPEWVPRQPKGYGATIYILYVYSGHRREGDVIHWAKTLGSARGLVIEVVTIDVIYDDKLCDMRSDESEALGEACCSRVLCCYPWSSTLRDLQCCQVQLVGGWRASACEVTRGTMGIATQFSEASKTGSDLE